MTKPWGIAFFIVEHRDDTSFVIHLQGRDRWALECLIAAGAKGCTPIDTPGPRWASYVHNLRAAGVNIETVTEPHEGAFRGHHARYVLKSRVTRVAPRPKGGAA